MREAEVAGLSSGSVSRCHSGSPCAAQQSPQFKVYEMAPGQHAAVFLLIAFFEDMLAAFDEANPLMMESAR